MVPLKVCLEGSGLSIRMDDECRLWDIATFLKKYAHVNFEKINVILKT